MRSTQGFTFVEIMIAMMIFVVGILGVMSLQGIALTSSDFSGNMNLARILASDQVERLEGLPFTDPAVSVCVASFCHRDVGNGTGGFTPNVTLDQIGSPAGNGRFLRDWHITQITPTVLNMTVRVRWTDAPGGAFRAQSRSFNRSLQMSTIKINPS